MRDGRGEPAQAGHRVSAVPQEALQHRGTRHNGRMSHAQQLAATGGEYSCPRLAWMRECGGCARGGQVGILGTSVRNFIIYSMCLMGLGRFGLNFTARIRSILLNGVGMRGSGTGDGEPSPYPPDPTGIDFLRFSSPWGIKSPHPCPLIGEFPMGNQGSGPRCHL